jgi:hypothetical protein
MLIKSFRLPVALGIALVLSRSAVAGPPTVVSAYQKSMNIQLSVTDVGGSPTQMAWGPDGRLYVVTSDKGVFSFAYNKTTGVLSDQKLAAAITGLGIAFHKKEMYISTTDASTGAGAIWKLEDNNGNGVWGETQAGELNVGIVNGIPVGDHDVDNLQVIGDTLYVGVGRRTINGRNGRLSSGSLDDYGGSGFWSGGLGDTWGDSACNGTICWIQNLNKVKNSAGGANIFKNSTLTQQLVQDDTTPLRTTLVGNLLVHSAGCRNPFGLCVDSKGNLYFTNNFNRTYTNGNGTSGAGHITNSSGYLNGDALGPDFSKDVYDQVFKAAPGADYGYHDDNWRPKNPMLNPLAPGYTRVTSITFDNLFNQGPYAQYDPTKPNGLGPSASPDGCSFFYAPHLPSALAGNMFICRYNSPITETSPGTHTITYCDLVAVNVSNGKVNQVATGFNNPLCCLSDGGTRLLVGEYGSDSGVSTHHIYALTVP